MTRTDRQRELEQEMADLGVARDIEQVRKLAAKGMTSESRPALAVTMKSTERLVQAFTKMERGRPDALKQALRGLQDPQKLAFGFFKVIVDELGKGSLAPQTLGSRLIAYAEDNGLLPYLKDRIVVAEENLTRLERMNRARLAMLAYEWVEQQTDLLDVESETVAVGKSKMKTIKRVSLSSTMRADLAGYVSTPRWLPCVITPKRWEAGQSSGGYHSEVLRQRLTLVKNRGRMSNYVEDLSHIEMPAVFEAINAVQETAWKINQPVYEVARWMQDLGKSLDGLIVNPELREENRRAWNRKAFAVARRTGEAPKAYPADEQATTTRALEIINKYGFAAEPAIYFPHQMDFRGRLYPVPVDLNPQAEDSVRALLTFAAGKPLGERGAWWLAVHGANTYGEEDKGPFEDRVKWVKDNEEKILASAADPKMETWWRKADAPWQFLAFCFEWAGFKREGPSFVSHLPVSLDGTCNGLQHFSAMLLDEVGGKAVNLLPGDRQDIYQRVADVVTDSLRAAGSDEAMQWLPLVDRKLMKLAVMTLPYGAGDNTRKNQIIEELVERVKDGKISTKPGEMMVRHLVEQHVTPAIGAIVPSAKRAMDWLQEVAVAMAEVNLPVQWQTPAGLVVQQRYVEMEKVVVKYKKKEAIWKMPKATPEIDAFDNRLGIAANFVHSLDAAHLMLTVNAAKARGLTSFAMIHDSYGTVAADVEVLAEVLRQEFVTMYQQHDVLAELRAMQPEDIAVGAMLEKGSLDLTAVCEARYFFA